MSTQAIKKDLLSMFMAAVKAVQVENLIKQNVKVIGNSLQIRENRYDLSEKNVYMIGMGKAAQNMAKEMEKQLGDQLKKGIVSIPKNSLIEENITGKVMYLEGGKSNLPDQDSVNNTLAISNLAKSLTKDDLLVVLISGGGSALLSLPEAPVTLGAKLDIINKLALNGADIKELNCVRKRISAVKGGKLAMMAHPATVISLILSDIVGDPVDLIASAPTEYNKDPKEKAIMILKKYNLYSELSLEVKNVIEKDQIDNNFPHSIKNLIIGSNKLSLEAAKIKAEELGYEAIVVSSKLTGYVSDVAKIFFKIVELINNNNFSRLNEYLTHKFDEFKISVTKEAIHNCGLCLIFGGETTVNVRGKGVGGRNQHLALEFAETIGEHAGNIENLDINLLCAGTDGIDGPTDAAGAIIYKNLVKDATFQDLCVKDHLTSSDSYNFFKTFRNGDMHIKCGHTQTNVMDINILMIKIN